MSERLFQVGDKVIPISKSVGRSRCQHYEKIKSGEADFLYITSNDGREMGQYRYTLSASKHGGNYYLESDLVPYAVDEEELFTRLVQGKISEAQYEAWKGVE